MMVVSKWPMGHMGSAPAYDLDGYLNLSSTVLGQTAEILLSSDMI